jgi:hypothetical protein
VAPSCKGCEGWLGRAAGAAPRCTRAGCPGAADGDGWVLVQARGGRASGSARTEVRVAMAAWLTAGAPSVGASLHVTAVGQPRKDGTCRSEVKLSLGVMRGPAEVKTQVRVAGARAQQGTGVRLRLTVALKSAERGWESTRTLGAGCGVIGGVKGRAARVHGHDVRRRWRSACGVKGHGCMRIHGSRWARRGRWPT